MKLNDICDNNNANACSEVAYANVQRRKKNYSTPHFNLIDFLINKVENEVVLVIGYLSI